MISAPGLPCNYHKPNSQLGASLRHAQGISRYILDLDSAQPSAMAPSKLKLAPFVVKSEPSTPVYVTTTAPEEAPDEWFAPVNHREKLAIKTIEIIPLELAELSKNHASTSPTQYFSPRLLPLLDRMKFHFSRVMALARCEAENGVFNWRATPNKQVSRILREDVMSSLEVEVFLAGIEEIRDPQKDNRVVFRRYWRIIAPPEGLKEEHKLGGVVSAGSPMKHHAKQGIKLSMDKHWDDTPKLLIAEFTVRADGLPTDGRMLELHEDR